MPETSIIGLTLTLIWTGNPDCLLGEGVQGVDPCEQPGVRAVGGGVTERRVEIQGCEQDGVE